MTGPEERWVKHHPRATCCSPPAVQLDSYQTEDWHWSMAQGLGTPALELTVGSSSAVSKA